MSNEYERKILFLNQKSLLNFVVVEINQVVSFGGLFFADYFSLAT